MSLDNINTQINWLRDYIWGIELLWHEEADENAVEVTPLRDSLLDEAQILLGRACEALGTIYAKKEYYTVETYVRMQGFSFLKPTLHKIAANCDELCEAVGKSAIPIGEMDEYSL